MLNEATLIVNGPVDLGEVREGMLLVARRQALGGAATGTLALTADNTCSGASIGLLSSSNVLFNSFTRFEVELNGASPGLNHDQLDVHGTLTLNNSQLVPVTVESVAVSHGLFTVELDFGALGSTPRWLEIEVQSRAGGSGYVVLSPRQSLTATPRAHYALQAGDVLNPVPDALIPATVARLGGNNVFTGAHRCRRRGAGGYPGAE